MSLALVLQAWGDSKGKGDISAAVDLCRLLADIEDSYRSDVTFLFIYGKGTPAEQVTAAINHLSPKFKAEGCMARNFGVGSGHPNGSNMLFFSALEEAAGRYKVSVGTPRNPTFPHNGVLFFEADCVPMRRDWINALTKEWQESVIAEGEWTDEEEDPEKRRVSGWPRYECLGHFHEPHNPDHVNGNMIQRPDIMDRHPLLRRFTTDVGWDMCNGQYYKRISRDTQLILQDYKKPDIMREEIPRIMKANVWGKDGKIERKKPVKPALFHGCQGAVGVKARRFMRELLVDGVPA